MGGLRSTPGRRAEMGETPDAIGRVVDGLNELEVTHASRMRGMISSTVRATSRKGTILRKNDEGDG